MGKQTLHMSPLRLKKRSVGTADVRGHRPSFRVLWGESHGKAVSIRGLAATMATSKYVFSL